MTRRELQIAIKHARETGREALARSLEFCWADVLNAAEPTIAPKFEGSPINPVVSGEGPEFGWRDVRASQEGTTE